MNSLPPYPNSPKSGEEMDYHGVHRDVINGVADTLPRQPTRVTSLTDAASNIVDPLVNNGQAIGSALQGAIQVLDSLSDVGRALPFIAPAFVLFKIIINLEKKAQEVDAKCSDLVERITFMLSHLPALQGVEFITPTRQVVDRINETLKDAAALIAAYRKQNRVARRLSLSNRDKFTACAQSVNTCCSDLLMSLQIHQTLQLDILTRAVPIDEEDKAAQTFVDDHGGSIDAVVHDRELVKEFAQQQHLVMDDSVMEQLNANIADSVQQNHARLEGILLENVNSTIAGGLKNLALEFSILEAEQKFVCVQCEKEFTNYTNGPLACSFHRAGYSSEKKHYPCCSTKHPCQFGAHRAKHHCDYPYATFFPRAWGISGYVDTRTEWTSIQDTNFETNQEQSAYIGQLLRWVTHGALLDESTIILVVGKLSYNSPYYFDTFTAKELEDVNQSIRISKRTLIYRTSSDENEFAMAEWVLSISGEITGIRLTAKAATSTDPWVRICPINLSTCTKSGDILNTSQGGLYSYMPASPYVLPETVSFGPILNDKQTRLPRTDFKTTTTQALRVILKSMADPPLQANPNFANNSSDYFVGKVSVFNNNAPGSLNPITISSVSAAYRLVGDPEYAPAKQTKLLDGDYKLPVTIEPRQCWYRGPEEDIKLAVTWWNRAFVARNRPIRIKLIVEDIEGEQCSLVMEYVFMPFKLETRRELDLGFFYFDSQQTFTRNHIRVVDVPVVKFGGLELMKNFVVEIVGSVKLSVKSLKYVVYEALKTGKTEVDLKYGREKDNGLWEWHVYALVDISCRRVYAFKIMMHEGKKVPVKRMGTLGYVLCPDYGDVVNETRPISYATETAKLPPMEPYVAPEYVQDDDLDDFKTPVPLKPATTIDTPTSLLNGVTVLGIPEDLTNRLTSIDTNLARIADAFERLLTVLPAVSANGRAH
ncbi:hypothetical protein CPB84DRAFT_1889010 [Gymnopilus junonius]|uniref:Mixed lineage kinase domain-containing protein n=1 Tax=Gymnopilus junonius TaxID=109634 RepID=A0A9P5NRB5_GYMJU|nr:hypothetical protein CPB84DRAFT_1889010 [Gymnopilus junonius]